MGNLGGGGEWSPKQYSVSSHTYSKEGDLEDHHVDDLGISPDAMKDFSSEGSDQEEEEQKESFEEVCEVEGVEADLSVFREIVSNH
jgi:hypothetical protein